LLGSWPSCEVIFGCKADYYEKKLVVLESSFCKMTDYVYEFDIVGFGVFDLEMTNG